MLLNDYQKLTRRTANYPIIGGHAFVYPTIKLAGETGEVSELVGKMFRDDKGVLSEERRQKLKMEMGDILWYLASMAIDLNFSLNEIAQANLDKLERRKAEGKIHGEGSDR